MRHWAGVDSFGFSSISADSVSLNFAVTPITSTSVSIQGVVLNYISYSEGDKYMLFGKKTDQDSTSLLYYFEADSMSYYHYERTSLCCFALQQWHSRK